MANGYTVDSIAQSFTVGAAGQLQDTVTVTFVTDAGDTGTVRVPLQDGWQDAATSQIETQVAQYNALRGSGGQTASTTGLP